MKRLLTTISLFLAALTLWAAPDFSAGKRYHIVCQQFTQGCVTDGATAGQPTPVYYLTTATANAETYWTFTEAEDGVFYIRNAKTGQYVTYDGVRDTYRRYVSMTAAPNGDNSLWSFVMMSNGIYVIRNAAQPNQVWDVRTDSYMVGTYSRSENFSNIERFYFYDEDNNIVTEKVTEETPIQDGFDVSSWLEATTDSPSGWNHEGADWSDPGFGSYYNENASIVSPFLERWQSQNNYGGLSDCQLTQTLRNMPQGNYTLQADVIAVRQGNNSSNYGTPAEGVYLFINGQQMATSTASERPVRYSVTCSLAKAGYITLGLKSVSTTANWIAIDNVRLYYHGTADELLEGELAKVRAELADYYSNEEINTLITQAGNNFSALEELRKSVANLPAIDPLSRVISQLNIDGHALSYVESLDLYLCSIPYELFGTTYTATVNYTQKDGAGILYIDNIGTPSGSLHNFKVSAGKNFAFSIRKSDGTTVKKNVTFTSLPVVKIYGTFNNDYSQGSIVVQENDQPITELMNMKAKWRGGITNSAGKNKRNYHVKLQDAEGNKLERKFFGLRNDNSWILESCQVDMSRIRNRVLTDLWNDYSTPPYYIDQEPKAKTGSRGHFVELVLNDEYRGIYCMTENMDRKQMKLMKYDETTGENHGMLWKSKDWSFAVMMGTRPNGNYSPRDYLSTPNAWSDMWDKYNVKYPDIEDVSPTDWQPLYDAVNFACYASDDEFKSRASEVYDLPLLIDYYILMETILSTDNHGKNMYFAIYDKAQSQKLTFGVWDMDATSGQRWSDDYYHASFLGPEQDYAQFITNYEHGDYNLFKRLRDTNADDFNEKVRLRYRDLRSNYLATESILQRFRTYLDEFKACGAAQREYERWNGNTDISRLNLDFDTEMDYITDWFTRRMNYLDTQRFDIASLPSDIHTPEKSYREQEIYNLNGQKVGHRSDIDRLPVGIYIIGGKKIVIK